MRLHCTLIAAIGLLVGAATTEGGQPAKRQTVRQRPPAVQQVSRRVVVPPTRPASHRAIHSETAAPISGYDGGWGYGGGGYGHGCGCGCGGPPFCQGACRTHCCCDCCELDLFGWLDGLLGPSQRGCHGPCAVGGCGCSQGCAGGGLVPYGEDGEAMPPTLKKLPNNGSPSDVPPPPKVPR